MISRSVSVSRRAATTARPGSCPEFWLTNRLAVNTVRNSSAGLSSSGGAACRRVPEWDRAARHDPYGTRSQ